VIDSQGLFRNPQRPPQPLARGNVSCPNTDLTLSPPEQELRFSGGAAQGYQGAGRIDLKRAITSRSGFKMSRDYNLHDLQSRTLFLRMISLSANLPWHVRHELQLYLYT